MFPISHHGPEMKVMMSAISFGFEIIHSVAELKRIYICSFSTEAWVRGPGVAASMVMVSTHHVTDV